MEDRFILTNREEGFVEGYALACSQLYTKMTGDSTCGKSYDPMTIRDGVMHSYAFDMKDGGRHHPVSDYKSLDEICETLLRETHDMIIEHLKEMA